MSNSFVLPYVNPDTDGVCSAIALAFYLRKSRGEIATPIYWGKLDNETTFVLEQTGAVIYPAPNSLDNKDKYYIVDTHQKNQLPADLPFISVVEIIDHHPVGDPNMFPNAQITNEVVGAAATIIAEYFHQNQIVPSTEIAKLLFSAVISNTLDLKSPTTTTRDVVIVKWLSTVVAIDRDYVNDMFSARSKINDRSTSDVLKGDYKEFDFSGSKVGMSQLETTDIDGFLVRDNIIRCMEDILKEKKLDHFIFNCADIRSQRGALLSVPQETKNILAKIIPDAVFEGNIAYFSRILLRKSDLIPQLKEYFSSTL